MTNVETMTKLEIRNSSEPRFSSFARRAGGRRGDRRRVIRHSFGLRHLSFVIFLRFLLLLLLMLEVSCVPDRLRQANVDEVAVGMSRKQVESILGPPTETDTKDLPVTKTLTYLYRQRSGTVTIVFKEDKVAEKQSTLTR
jgi:hypothetical protein